MNNFKILKELIKRFQGVRAVLYFAEIIGMGVADGISVVLVSRIIGIITDTAVSKGNLRDTQLVKYIILTIIFKIIIQTLLAVLYNDEAKRTGANMRNTVYGKALSLPMNSMTIIIRENLCRNLHMIQTWHLECSVQE